MIRRPLFPEAVRPVSQVAEQDERQAVSLELLHEVSEVQDRSAGHVVAERAVAASVLADNSLLDWLLDVLRPADFGDPAAREVFGACARVFEGIGEEVTVAEPMTLAADPAVRKHLTYAQICEWVAGASRDPAVVRGRAVLVRQAAIERGLAAAIGSAQGILSQERSIELRSQDISQLFAGAADVRTLPLTSVGNAATAALTDLMERASRGETGVGIPTGIDDLDALTAGMHGGQLIVIGARPGIGKTAFALTTALNAAAAGKHVVYASFEMKATELSKRALAVVSGVDGHSLRVGALNEGQWEQLVGAAEQLQKLPLSFMDLPTASHTALMSLCRRLRREGKLSALYVDYLQLMEGSTGKGSNREREISDISRALKQIAMHFGIPVVALSQLSRAVEGRANKVPQLSDLRESGSIEQDADVVVFIHRDDQSINSQAAMATADLLIAKQRSGALGQVRVGVNRATTEFFNLHDPIGRQSLRAA